MRSTVLAAGLVLIPTSALAVRFGDIGYDVPGADAGREWIQIVNDGPAPLNLAGLRLYEGGVNHKLTAVGASTVPAGAAAVIVESPDGYLADHPGYSGLMFKASFSLSNTGESLALKDASSTVMASTTYTAAPKAPPAPPPAKVPKSTKAALPAGNPRAPVAVPVGSSTAAAADAAAPTPLMPWLVALGVVIAAAGAGIYFVRTGASSDYKISEIKND